MAYDELLADRIRSCLEGAGIEEKEMFGGLSFLLNGNMSVGVIKDELMVRVGKERHDDLVGRPGVRIMDFTGRPMKGWLIVAADAVADDEALADWVDRGLNYAASLPPK